MKKMERRNLNRIRDMYLINLNSIGPKLLKLKTDGIFFNGNKMIFGKNEPAITDFKFQFEIVL